MIVTGIDRETSWYMQSADAANPDYTGIFVFVPDSNPDDITIPAIGDIINVVGDTDDFYGLAEITFVAEPEVVSTGSVIRRDRRRDRRRRRTAGARGNPGVGPRAGQRPSPAGTHAGDQDDEPRTGFAIMPAGGADCPRRRPLYLLDPMPLGDRHDHGNLRFNHTHFLSSPGARTTTIE
jgi:hypothetical protein